MNVYKVKGTVAECIKNETVSIGLLKSFQNGSSPLRGRHFFVFFNPSRFLNAVSIKIAGRKITIAKCSIQQLAFPKWKRKPALSLLFAIKLHLKLRFFQIILLLLIMETSRVRARVLQRTTRRRLFRFDVRRIRRYAKSVATFVTRAPESITT